MDQEVAKQKQDDTFDNLFDEFIKECDQQNITTPRNNENKFVIKRDDVIIRGSIPSELFSMTQVRTLKICSDDLCFRIGDLQNLTNLSSLTISHCNLTFLPDSIGNFTNLAYLDVNDNKLTNLPDSIGHLTKLNNLSVHRNKLTTLPDRIGHLINLMQLQVRNNELTALPDSIGNLTNFTELDVSDNQLTSLPDSIGHLTKLNNLDVSNNKLTTLPYSIGNLTNLNNLDVHGNKLTTLPYSIGNLTNLNKLDVANHQLGRLPDSIGHLTKLHELDVSYNQLTVLPDSIGNLINLDGLDVSHNQLTILPDSIGNLTKLKALEVHDNQLTILPDSIGNLTLKELNVNCNKLSSLPDSIGNLTNLIKLIVCQNQLTDIVESIGNLTRLTHVAVQNNRLTTLPYSIGNLTNLTKLIVSYNQMTTLPDSIGNLTKLNELEVHDNELTILPDSIGMLTLIELNVNNNKLISLPDSIGNLTNLMKLNVCRNQLTCLADSIGNLSNLRELKLMHNQLTILPDSIGHLTSLMSLILSFNQLSSLPDSIGKLRNLKQLSVSFNQLTVLPNSFGSLTNLAELNLSDNHLINLPDTFGNLINLYQLNYERNHGVESLIQNLTWPSARTLNKISTTFKVAERIANVGLWRHMRLFLVGDSAAGKTSIVRWLKGMQFDENHNSTDSVEVSTADMNEWKDVTFDIKDYVAEILSQPCGTAAVNNEAQPSISKQLEVQVKCKSPKIQTSMLITQYLQAKQQKAMKSPAKQELPWTFHIWDFGGQEEYYNTHHFFLNSSAIYLLIVDISQPLNLSRLQFWIDSVRYYAPTAPIIIIGTHKDKVPDGFQQRTTKIFDSFEQDIYNCSVKYCYGVSCVNDDSLHTRQILKEVAERHEAFNTPCKLSWMLLFDELRKLKNLRSQDSNDNNTVPNDPKILAVMPFEKALEIATTMCGMNIGTLEENTEELKNALKFFHQLGFFIYLEVPILCDIIFVHSQQLIDALRCVITGTNPFLSKRLEESEFQAAKTEGRISQLTLQKLWKEYPAHLHHSLRMLLQQFQLGLPDPSQHDLPESERDIIIPCLVSNIVDPSFPNAITCVCEITGMPPLGFQSRVIVDMMQLVHRESSQCKVTIFTTEQTSARGIEFNLYGVPVRVTVESRKVKIQVKSSEPNTVIVDIFKKIFQEINNVCFCHNNTLERRAIIFFCSNPNCEGNTLCDASVSWKELRLQDLHCHLCVVPHNSSDNNNNSSPTHPAISSIQFGVEVQGRRFYDLMQEDDLRWSKLGRILLHHWKELGTQLGPKYFDLESLKLVIRYNQNFNPSAEMLRKWQHSSDATVDRLLQIFEKIDNRTAVTMLLSFIQEPTSQTMLRDVYQVLKLLHNLRPHLDKHAFGLNWERLATELGYEYNQIVIFDSPATPHYSPTVELLKDWMARPQSTVERLLAVLRDMQNQAAEEAILNHLSICHLSSNNNNNNS